MSDESNGVETVASFRHTIGRCESVENNVTQSIGIPSDAAGDIKPKTEYNIWFKPSRNGSKDIDSFEFIGATDAEGTKFTLPIAKIREHDVYPGLSYRIDIRQINNELDTESEGNWRVIDSANVTADGHNDRPDSKIHSSNVHSFADGDEIEIKFTNSDTGLSTVETVEPLSRSRIQFLKPVRQAIDASVGDTIKLSVKKDDGGPASIEEFEGDAEARLKEIHAMLSDLHRAYTNGDD